MAKYSEYEILSQRDLVGVNIIVLAKKSIKNRIWKIESDVVKTGLMAGTFGNKGAVLVKMSVDDS